MKDPVTGKDVKKSLAWGQANGLDAAKFGIAVGTATAGALALEILEDLAVGAAVIF